MTRTQAELAAYRQGALDVVDALVDGLHHAAAAFAAADPTAAAQATAAASMVGLMRPMIELLTGEGLQLRDVHPSQLDGLLAGGP